MPLDQAVVWAVILGFTKLFPISSIASPVLFPWLLDRTDGSLAFDFILDANILEEN